MRAALILLALALGACSLSPVHYPTLNEHPLKLGKGQLEAAGIAFVTPSTVTGQEQNRAAGMRSSPREQAELAARLDRTLTIF